MERKGEQGEEAEEGGSNMNKQNSSIGKQVNEKQSHSSHTQTPNVDAVSVIFFSF